jgi:quinoprotein glucose dehydrogenase
MTTPNPRRILSFVILAAVLGRCGPSADAQEILPDGREAALKAISGFRFPDDMTMDVYAAEPQLSGPVAICVDDRGRVFVAEEYRFNRGTEENRTRPFLLDVDLQIDSLEQRLAAFEKHKDKFEGGMDWFTKVSDQIRLLEDTDGDGRADKSSVFAKFNEPLDGLAAGVIARGGDVYVTCIPHLWLMRDEDGDGVADVRKSLHRGFGVNNAFLGHDLHGLVWGPDGRLYFSVGDRGYNLVNHEGKHLYGPRRGAVFRCEPDGSHLEVVHTSLRNPQELAFDEFGNLFAADNNCDKGDLSRLVYVVEGGDSGWNMAYQTIPDPYLTGPWHAEKLWHVNAPDQPAYIVPPVGALGAGPSGFTYYPGVGLSERYAGHFFMCNYTGNGGIESFAVKPKGAGFEIFDEHDFLKPIKATDVEFGYNGVMYVSDFVNLDWSGKSLGGRIYALSSRKRSILFKARESGTLLESKFREFPDASLIFAFQHPDMRVRLRAQFKLAGLGAEIAQPALEIAALGTDKSPPISQRVRLHAIWCMGQLLRAARKAETVRDTLETLLTDKDPEIRAQAVRVLEPLPSTDGGFRGVSKVIRLLSDPSLRVRFFAAMAVARMPVQAALEPVVQLLRENADRDLFVRHAGVMALNAIADDPSLRRLVDSKDRPVRLAALLAMRRRASPNLHQFLNDPDIAIATEASRAINDLPIDTATAALAGIVPRIEGSPEDAPDALVRRVINANFRLGSEDHARNLVRLVTTAGLSTAMRAEALACLSDWVAPGKRDRVNGFWRPLETRKDTAIRRAVQDNAPALLAGTDGTLLTSVLTMIAKYDIKVDDAQIAAWADDADRPDETRVASLNLLAARKAKQFDDVLTSFRASKRPALRIAAWQQLASSDPADTVNAIEKAMASESTGLREMQAALAILAQLNTPRADKVIESSLRAAIDQSASRPLGLRHILALELDIVSAADNRTANKAIGQLLTEYKKRQNESAAEDPLARHRSAMFGGTAQAGEAIFRGHRRAQCLRCHKVNGNGGTAGPDLTKLAAQTHCNREFLLESLIDPHAKIAKGFGTVTFVLEDGFVLSGVIESESPEAVVVRTPEGRTVTLKPDDIDVWTTPKSPMPGVGDVLKLSELRDLIEFLNTLK